MKAALAQINTTVGDFQGNTEKILNAYQRGTQAGLDLVMTPELAITGYPPRDLLLNRLFIKRNLQVLEHLAQQTSRTALLVGFVGSNETGLGVTNSVALLQHGKITATRSKTLLSRHDVFNEHSYFTPGAKNLPLSLGEQKVGLTIGEELWNDQGSSRHPLVELEAAGARVLLNISASPWHLGKNHARHNLLSLRAAKLKCPVLCCHACGGNDELIFDGESLVFNAAGALAAQGALFAEDYLVVDTDKLPAVPAPQLADEEMLYGALVLGLRDYFYKSGFKSAVLGLSGGIDSALTAALAVKALGKENVRGYSLPSQFSSQGSLDDARAVANNLGIHYEVIPIQPIFEAAKQQLKQAFGGRPEDVTEENMQARARGMVLMSLSNKFNSLLLATGNKSEVAAGYCTLYGDTCGALAPISDLTKTMVYRLSNWINREREIIPQASITKAPSAELRPNQKDQDSLPPYDLLDQIIELYIVEGQAPAEIVAAGFDAKTVQRVVRLIETNEYKRHQAAVGLKVSTRGFGGGRHMPVVQRFIPG